MLPVMVRRSGEKFSGVPDGSRRHDDVHALLGGAAVAGDPVEDDGEVGLLRHEGALPNGYLSCGDLGPVVDAKDAGRFAGQLVPQTVGEHGPGAAGGLLGGLEEEGHIPGDLLPHGGEETGGAVEPGGVEVVAAGVHDAGHL